MSSSDDDMEYSDEDEELGPVQRKWPFGGKGKSVDVPAPVGSGCLEINTVLARASTLAGEYTFGGLADTLPAIPGLVVEGVGAISVPLTEENAEKLIAKAEKSPFGHNFDTKLDENVRKSWQLSPDQVQFTNTQWQIGIDKLTKNIAERLGYTSIPMQSTLYKMLIYGEDGHFLKHQDTEKEDGMVATLVVQLPSTHEGGDLVIYRGGEVKYRHDFGKKEGTSGFLPHYAVHYADAEHALEKVTKGVRLVLVYSICLPLHMQHMKKNSDKLLSDELAEAYSKLGLEESFALLLSHEYTEKSIRGLGSGALKGIDRSRYAALEDANSIVSADKKLQFFIAEMKHEIQYYSIDGYEPGHWDIYRREDTTTWYSTTGQRFGTTKSTTKINFLNPGSENYYELWRTHGSCEMEEYTGNDGPTMETTYSRYAVIAWPGEKAVEKTLECINSQAAIHILHSQKSGGVEALRRLMEALQSELKAKIGPQLIAPELCQELCQLLVEARDVGLVQLFISEIFTKISSLLSEKTAMAPAVAKLLQAFEWKEVGEAFLNSLDALSNNDSMLMALRVADTVTNAPARNALLQRAVENVAELNDELLNVPGAVGFLWKFGLAFENVDFDAVAKVFKTADPSRLGQVIEDASPHLDNANHSSDMFAVLVSIASKRIAWLQDKIQGLDKPFSWEMPEAEFAVNAKVQEFLRGPDSSMVTKDVVTFKTLQGARNYAAKCSHKYQVKASFVMEASVQNGIAFVTITKTKSWFSEHQHLLLLQKKELDTLMDCYEETIASTASKKPRLEK